MVVILRLKELDFTPSRYSLGIAAGPGVGVLTAFIGDDFYITIDGANIDPVYYETDEWSNIEYGPGTELPIDDIVKAIEEFINSGELPQSVQWKPFDLYGQKQILKGQAAEPSNEFGFDDEIE